MLQNWSKKLACHLFSLRKELQDEFYPKQLDETHFLKNAQENNQAVHYNKVEGYDHSYFFIATFLEEHFAFHMKILKIIWNGNENIHIAI